MTNFDRRIDFDRKIDFNRRIVIDGNDGTGKSTLVNNLKKHGFTNIHDRAEMTSATDDDNIEPKPDTDYIMLTCDWNVSYNRLLKSGRDMNDPYHKPEALQYYQNKFKQIAEKFSAKVIDTADIESNEAFHKCISLLGIDKIKIGYPKNRDNNERSYIDIRLPIINLVSRPKIFPQMVAMGMLDVAYCGNDVVESSPFKEQIEIFGEEKMGESRMCVISQSGKIPERKLLRVATSYRDIAHEYFGKLGLPHTIIDVPGCVEGFVPLFADVIIDIVETGKTLERNNLFIVEKLFDLKTLGIRRKQ